MEEKVPMGRMLDRTAILLDLGKTTDKPWWGRWRSASEKLGAVHNFSLAQKGTEIAAISTVMEPCDGVFHKGMRCRRTVVTFEDTAWTISTHPVRSTGEAMAGRFGKRWRKADRIVEATRDSPGIEGGYRIAHLANPSAWRYLGSMKVITADGTTVTLTPRTAGRRFLTGEAAEIKKVKRGYRLTPKYPVPLSAMLLHWHVMLGDIRIPRPDGGSGTKGK